MTTRLETLVIGALANAEQSGADFTGWSSDEIADDMIDYDAEIAEIVCGEGNFNTRMVELLNLIAKHRSAQ